MQKLSDYECSETVYKFTFKGPKYQWPLCIYVLSGVLWCRYIDFSVYEIIILIFKFIDWPFYYKKGVYEYMITGPYLLYFWQIFVLVWRLSNLFLIGEMLETKINEVLFCSFVKRSWVNSISICYFFLLLKLTGGGKPKLGGAGPAFKNYLIWIFKN